MYNYIHCNTYTGIYMHVQYIHTNNIHGILPWTSDYIEALKHALPLIGHNSHESATILPFSHVHVYTYT